MAEHVALFKVTTMSRALEVSRSGFYAWLQRVNKPSPQAQRRDHLDGVVKAAFVAGKGRSGSPRLTLDLVDAGEVFDRETVANSQRRQGLRAKAGRARARADPRFPAGAVPLCRFEAHPSRTARTRRGRRRRPSGTARRAPARAPRARRAVAVRGREPGRRGADRDSRRPRLNAGSGLLRIDQILVG